MAYNTEINHTTEKRKYSSIQFLFEKELLARGINHYQKRPNHITGTPDFVFENNKIAVFCLSSFWHGYDMKKCKARIKNQNQKYPYLKRIKRNRSKDNQNKSDLEAQGWKVLQFWSHEIKNCIGSCIDILERELRCILEPPYKTIDLCAGIGGIRKGFELTGQFKNILSAEVDRYACLTYEHLYGENPLNDLTSENFKKLVEATDYDVLLAGFPCQTFSRSGKQEGFDNEEKGQIFFHIAEIIKRTRPMALFFENVDSLITHDNGKTFETIIEILTKELHYFVIGYDNEDKDSRKNKINKFVRNSKDFGVPQNRPRTYIIAFNAERFSLSKLEKLPQNLPVKRAKKIYTDLNDLLETNVNPKYYIASGYLDTLIKHRAREREKGNGFGYRVVNEESIENPIANTILATGGSGKERNLIYDPKEGIAGSVVPGKKTPLNDKGIRFMTPSEWGKLQGFINYAFIDDTGIDHFSFPDGIMDTQQYKQFGNSVTIPVIEEMAKFMAQCIQSMS